jgi:hypothetical protein
VVDRGVIEFDRPTGPRLDPRRDPGAVHGGIAERLEHEQNALL